MDSSVEEKEADEQYELHKAVFDNDLKKLNQIIKSNKDLIDKKVKCEILSRDWPKLLIELVFLSCSLDRINMVTQHCT